MSYCTLPEVLVRMGHDGAASRPLDDRISAAILAATTAIDNDTGRSFTPVTEARTFGTDRCTDVLRVPDLVSVSALKVDDDDDGVFETTITDYELDTYRTSTGWPFDVVRLFDRDFPIPARRRRRVEITGTWGWAAVPAPINQAASLMAARIAQRTSAALFGTQSFGDFGAAPIRSQDPDYLALIAPYRRPQVA